MVSLRFSYALPVSRGVWKIRSTTGTPRRWNESWCLLAAEIDARSGGKCSMNGSFYRKITGKLLENHWKITGNRPSAGDVPWFSVIQSSFIVGNPLEIGDSIGKSANYIVYFPAHHDESQEGNHMILHAQRYAGGGIGRFYADIGRYAQVDR